MQTFITHCNTNVCIFIYSVTFFLNYIFIIKYFFLLCYETKNNKKKKNQILKTIILYTDNSVLFFSFFWLTHDMFP